MKENSKQTLKNNIKEEINENGGYPVYPQDEDIYNKSIEEEEIDPEEISKNKKSIKNNKIDETNEKKLIDDKLGRDLDIPGSELDDEMEDIGSEDEENNYYSLGGDKHNDLDEN